jgi:drug/metabolite transporter (DMT)-like permease
MTHYPVSEVLTLTNMFPLWVAVLSWPLLREQPSMEVWAAMVVGIVGVAVMQQRPEEAVAAFSFLPVPIAVLSSFTSAIALIGLHRLREIDSRAIVVHFSGVALGFCILSLFIFPRAGEAATEGTRVALSPWQIGGLLLAMGIFATIGQLLLTKAFAAGPPAKISVVGLSQVAFAMLLEMSLTHRTFGAMTMLGIALVISPTIWILLRRAH